MPTYDLSHRIHDSMPVYPGDPAVECHPLATVAADGYRTTELTLSTHAGTHVDAPAHLLEDGRSIDDYDLETFRFTAAVIDCTGIDPRTPIETTQVQKASETWTLDAIDLALLRTGWDSHWGTETYHDHPYLTDEAARILADEGVHLGLDTPNIDPTPPQRGGNDEPDGYPAHHVLFEQDRVILENLRGLDRLPTDDTFEVYAYPLSVDAPDGAPVRAVAIV
ncbi:putative metal-dependent hydrolase [Halovivax ruber XH-70]|uniref:Putative metal-dependent hydrolase n=1 Tax=Halovivax ruber (strain DSM 18193 / JCM 13892 / XH-70) TaxID=797302 RepID=L0I987_HALRX|nr:cyclase family protein [Halovivax ruber]AGB16175.1 putative metal-dependent hydrolase [Halovivax ruber XH-70]